MTDSLYVNGGIEPQVNTHSLNSPDDALTSIAISLKRIADVQVEQHNMLFTALSELTLAIKEQG